MEANQNWPVGAGAGPAPPAAPPAAPPTQDVYLIRAHGEEDLWKKPPLVKEGFTLVTFAECGDTVLLSGYKEATQFADPYTVSLLSDPVKNKSEIEELLGRSLRIYTAGMPMPPIHLTLLLDWKKNTDTKYTKSGVYKAPISLTDFIFTGTGQYTSGEDFFTFAKELTPELVSLLYSGSVFPTEAEAQKEFFAEDRQGGKLSVGIEEVMVSPGVYYAATCRAISSSLDPLTLTSDINRLLEKRIAKPKGNKRGVGPYLPYYKQNAAELEKIIREKTEVEKVIKEAIEVKEALELQIQIIEKRRAASTERQRQFATKGGRRRRTRRYKLNRFLKSVTDA